MRTILTLVILTLALSAVADDTPPMCGSIELRKTSAEPTPSPVQTAVLKPAPTITVPSMSMIVLKREDAQALAEALLAAKDNGDGLVTIRVSTSTLMQAYIGAGLALGQVSR